MNTKICTTIEQSKRLIELGLDVETSDMHYIEDSSDNPYCELYASKLNEEVRKHYNSHYIPAWSLSALLGIMPFHTRLYQVKDFNKQGETYRFSFETNNDSFLFETYWHNDVVDAAFEMVCWLLEN